MAAFVIGIIASCACLLGIVFASRDYDGMRWSSVVTYFMLYLNIQSIIILVLLASATKP